MDRSELTRRLVSDAQECSRLFTRNWETKQKVLHQRQTAGSYGDNIAQAVMHHVVQCLKNGDLASTRPQNHIQPQHRGSMIECGINLELYKTSRCGIVGDPPRITCFSQGSTTDAHTHTHTRTVHEHMISLNLANSLQLTRSDRAVTMLMLRSVNKKIFIKTLVAKHRPGAAGRAVCYLICNQKRRHFKAKKEIVCSTWWLQIRACSAHLQATKTLTT